MNIFELTATEALVGLKSGKFSSAEVVQACLRRIDQREAVVGAWQYLNADYALQQADACDQKAATGSPSGALQGIPVAVKDIFATADMPTGWGTPIHAGQWLNYDAAVVERLRAAGAVIMGKTVSTEYALARPGKTKNPHNPDHTPGGSSSGSAAAVADGMVPLAIGTQTGGSILRPAAYCGVLGFKPSFGLISRYGAMPISRDLDHVGVFARSLTDIVKLCAVLIGPDGRDPDCIGGGWQQDDAEPLSGSPTPPRLGFIRTSAWEKVDAEAQAALVESLKVLSAAGATVVEVPMPADLDAYLETVDILMTCGAAVNHGGDYDQHFDALSPQLRQMIERGRSYGNLAYAVARQTVVDYSVALAQALSSLDGIVTPVTSGAAPADLHNTGSFMFCAPWTLCGVPALSLPIGKAANGLPMALQLVGARRADWALLQLASWVINQLGYPYGLASPV